MIDRFDPACFGQRFALSIRNGDERDILELGEQRRQFGHVETTMHGRDVRDRQTPHDRQVELRNVKVDDVEFVSALGDLLEHQDVGRERVAAGGIEAQRIWPHRDQPCLRLGIAGGEERHVVAEPHEFIRQECDNSFRASVQLRRNTFI